MKIEGMIEYTKKFTFPTPQGRPPQCKPLILHLCLVFSLSSPHPIVVNPVKSSGRKDWDMCRSSAEVRGFSSALILVLTVFCGPGINCLHRPAPGSLGFHICYETTPGFRHDSGRMTVLGRECRKTTLVTIVLNGYFSSLSIPRKPFWIFLYIAKDESLSLCSGWY